MAISKSSSKRVCAGEQKLVGNEIRSMQNRRVIYAALAVAVFTVGVLSRTIETHSVLLGKYLGDALYAIIFYACLAGAFPNQSILARATVITIFVVLVECFQLTGIPLKLRQGNLFEKLVSVVLGTKFSWYDMLAYAVGIATIIAVDSGLIVRGNK